MDVSRLFHVLDIITEEELRGLQTEHVTFMSFHTSKSDTNCFSRIDWCITNEKIEEIGISFFIQLHFFTKDLLLFETRISSFGPNKNYHYRGEMTMKILSKLIKEIEPIVMYLEEKRVVIEQNLKNNKIIKFSQMMGNIRFNSYNYALDMFEEAKQQ